MHERVICPVCGGVVLQCRCPGPHAIRYERCRACARAKQGSNEHGQGNEGQGQGRQGQGEGLLNPADFSRVLWPEEPGHTRGGI